MLIELQNEQRFEPNGQPGVGFGRRQPPPGNIDFNAPLLQLFWQTLLPFYHI